MSSPAAVFRHDSPVIIEPDYFVAALGDHRLDRDGHAGQQPRPASGCSEIGYAGILVQVRAYSVADELPYNRVTTHLDIPLHRGANIADAIARHRRFDAFVQAFAVASIRACASLDTSPAGKVAALSP